MAVQRLSTGLSSLVVGVILMVALFATGSHGQSVALTAKSVPLSNSVYEAYFGDGQSTTPIGNRLPECLGGTSGVANLSLKLENIVTNQVIQQTAITGRLGDIIWNPTLFPTVLSTLSGRYVCTIFSSSFMDTHTDTYQLNVVVAMSITCQYPANIKYESLNVLSCNVTGYPLPMISWNGINGTTPTPTLSGGINGTTTNTSIDGIYKITATNSIWGDQTESEPGSYVTVNVTAQYPAFNCTSLQNPTALRNPCESIPKVVTYTSKFLVVAACVPFTDTAFIPSTPPSTEYGTNFSIDCAPGYEYRPSTPTIDKMSCQANGSWTPFPTCIVRVVNCPGACQDTNATCMDIPGTFECRCNRGYTGSGLTPGSCDLDRCVSSPCNHASATCVNTMGSFFCQCPVSSVGITNDPCKSPVCAALCRDSNSVCQDNRGALSCGCRVGYNGSGLSINSCTNVNECLSSPCQDSLATCLDTEGSFLCLCPEELLGNGLKRGGCSRAIECPGTNSVGLTAGVGCGTFFLGSIIASLITWFLAKRKYGTDQTGNCRDPQVGKPPDVVTMTNSDAYGMVDIPTTQQQQPQYEYVLPEAQ